MRNDPLLSIELPGIPKVKSGRVRDIFDLGENLLFVATDRISVFDCILPNGIPLKGKALTQMSHYWLDVFKDTIPNHRVGASTDPLPEQLAPYKEMLEGRSMVVRKAKPLSIECVVRGYLFGSGWKEYDEEGSVSGIPLPPDLALASELDSPIFTPSTKSPTGHDQNISFEEVADKVGIEVAQQMCDTSIQLYTRARELAREKNIIIADTKFEFGLIDGKVVLIDEVLTPDSSRFWPLDRYIPGRSQPSLDKQYVRDYLASLEWNGKLPAPKLPDQVVAKTSAKYAEVCQQLTGQVLD